MKGIKIVIENDIAKVLTPYNEKFVTRIKKGIGGAKWNGAERCWEVPIESVDVVKDILLDIFGCDGEQEVKTVKVRIRVKEDLVTECGDVLFCAKVLSHAYGKNSGGKVGNDVFYVQGKPKSGGSTKWWKSIVEADSIIDIINVSKNLWERYLEEPNENIEILSVVDCGIDREALLLEKEKILKRLSEIEKLLEQ